MKHRHINPSRSSSSGRGLGLKELLIDEKLYEDLDGWAKAVGTTPSKIAEVCIMIGLAFNNLMVVAQEGGDPVREACQL